MESILFISGVLAGTIFVWIYFRYKTKNGPEYLETINNLEKETLEKSSKIELKNEQLNHYASEIFDLKKEIKELYYKSEQQTTSLATSITENKNLNEKLTTQKEELLNLQKHFTDQFNILANKILEEKSEKFTNQNKEQLNHLLSPLNEKLISFEKKIEDSYIKSLKDRTDLQVEIKKLYHLNAKISEEANNLTKALKGDVKKQGNWGELILERILETSGLEKNREFKTQVTLSNENGKKYQPDVIIYLPEDKHVVIDSKVSLIAYEEFVNSGNEDEKKVFIKQHLESLRHHIKQLADKQYYKLNGLNTPEYVLMFVPIEASFSVAINEDNKLFNFAWENKIVIVSPSTLVATLLTISSIWRQENQTKNALEIAKKSGDLYDKFVSFTENLIDLGQKLKQAENAYNSSMNKLSSGRGNLIKRAEDIKKLGAKTNKAFPKQLLDGSEP